VPHDASQRTSPRLVKPPGPLMIQSIRQHSRVAIPANSVLRWIAEIASTGVGSGQQCEKAEDGGKI